MNELIKISDYNGKKAVSARDLYNFLEIVTPFHKWMPRMLEYGFVESIDWTKLSVENQSFNIDYALSIDCAKEISMLQRTDKGKEARLYFIAMEKVALQPVNQFEFMQMQLNMMRQQSERIDSLEQKVNEIKALPQINAPIEHFSIMGYCHNIKRQISLNEAKAYGIKCRSLCNQLGFVIGKIADPRFGAVNTYPLDVLKQVID
jgi:anti-repressor protein